MGLLTSSMTAVERDKRCRERSLPMNTQVSSSAFWDGEPTVALPAMLPFDLIASVVDEHRSFDVVRVRSVGKGSGKQWILDIDLEATRWLLGLENHKDRQEQMLRLANHIGEHGPVSCGLGKEIYQNFWSTVLTPPPAD
jgi:hypothetical protein